MSRIEDEEQPGVPAADPVEDRPEPRLLTRPAPQEQVNGDGDGSRRQHFAEKGLQAWAGRLARRRRAAPRASVEDGDVPSSAPVTSPVPASSPARRRRWQWWALRLGALTLILIVISAVVMVLDLRHALRASLPQLDGEVPVAGLHAPVTVTRNAQGVPSIAAANLDDLLFAQGYVTASDRLWQMDGLRRHAAGELAEILGPGLVEHDRRQRYLQVRVAADRAAAALPRDQYAQLEAYARGVNAYIGSHRGQLPMEFRLLAYKPAPWTPRDSLLVSLAIYEDMSTGFPGKMNREALSTNLPAALLPDLYPVGSWRDLPPSAQGRNVTAPHDVEQIPLDPSQSRLAPQPPPTAGANELLALSTGMSGAGRCEGCRSGSNNWVVSGAHTASGGPMVSNDMHLNLSIPDIWYEASLHAGLTSGSNLDVVGFTLPGVPFVIVGRNTHVAWGLTNLGADVEDLRVEHLRGDGESTEFQRPDGSWALANHRPERIRVRGGRDLLLDVVTTNHAMGDRTLETPVISPLYPSEQRALSLAWTAYDPSTVTSPFLPINAAADGASLVASFASFGGPTLNLVWADDGNHIGYHALGRIPVRGPAVQHPRPVPAPIVTEPGQLPPDGDQPTDGAPAGSDDPTPEPAQGEPQASLEAAPHLVLSSFHPVRRRVAPGRPAIASPPARRRTFRHRPAAFSIPVTPAPALDTAVVPTPQPLNYTVGSALSPVPVDALDASQAWSGYIAYADMPAITDPANGLLATANSRITPDEYPWAVTDDWTDPFRTERIVHALSGRTGLTPADMLHVEMDVHSDVDRAMAQRLAYALDHAAAKPRGENAKPLGGAAKPIAHDTVRLKQAADLLRNWDGNMSVDSPAAAIVTAVREELWPALLIPQILAYNHANGAGEARKMSPGQAATVALLYTWGERTTALELLVQNQPARWLPQPYRRWSDFLEAVTESGLRRAHAPSDLRQWSYGDRHTVEIAHPLLGDQKLFSQLLGIQGTTGIYPAPGDGTTIRQMGTHFGPSERFTADLSSPSTAFANLTTGESGDGASPWYLDQFGPWLNGTTFALPLSSDATTHNLRLVPR